MGESAAHAPVWFGDPAVSSQVVALPRFDGRPATLLEPRCTAPGRRNRLSLRYWRPGIPFRLVSQAAHALALERARRAATVLVCQWKVEGHLLEEPPCTQPGHPLIFKSEFPRMASGGAEYLTELIREHRASVAVVDNLKRMWPSMHWTSPGSRLLEADRQALQEIRRLLSDSDFGRSIEVDVFHLLGPERARQLLEEGLVDEIRELRP